MTTKKCTKCGVEKEATTEYFSLGKRYAGGIRSICKDCERAYRQANRERFSAQQREYREVNKERKSAYDRSYRQANRERKLELDRSYRVANPNRKKQWNTANKVHVREYGRAYRDANKEKTAELFRNWSESNRERRNSYRRAYDKANPEVIRAIGHRRRARKRNASGSHTAADIRQQYQAQKGRCYYSRCGHSELGDNYHIDHVIPLSRGGSNGPENLVIACPSCNLSKKDKLPSEWLQGGRLL